MRATLAVLVLFSLVFIPAAMAQSQLACRFSSSGCQAGETEVFRASGTTNAHAELWSAPPVYTTSVCCGGIPGLANACAGTLGTDYEIVLRLSSPTNAHVEANTGTTYPELACLQGPSGTTEADCQLSQTSCNDVGAPGSHVCVATISGTTNAHVADCGAGAYPTKVCCDIGADVLGPVLTFVPPTPDPEAKVSQNTVTVKVQSDEELRDRKSPDEDYCTLWWDDALPDPPLEYSMTYDPLAWTCEYTVTDLRDGTYTYTVTAEDIYKQPGSTNPPDRAVTVAADYPVSTIAYPAALAVYNPATWTGTMTGTAFDSQDGITAVDVQLTRTGIPPCWDGADWVSSPCPSLSATLQGVCDPGSLTCTWTYPFNPADALRHGDLTVASRAQDGAGKLEAQPPSARFGIDTIVPSTSITSPAGGYRGTIVGGSPHYGVNIHDSLLNAFTSGGRRLEYQVEYKATGACLDTAGWNLLRSFSDAAVGYFPPQSGCQVNCPPERGLEEVTADFDVNAENPTGSKGYYRVFMQPADYGENYGAQVGDCYYLDPGYPTVDILAPAKPPGYYSQDGWSSATPIRGTAVDKAGTLGFVGIKQVEVSLKDLGTNQCWDGIAQSFSAPCPAFILAAYQGPPANTWSYPFTPSADMGLQIDVEAEDKDSNVATDFEGPIYYDTQSPVVSMSIVPPLPFLNTPAIALDIQATDNAPYGLATLALDVSTDGGTNWVLVNGNLPFAQDPVTGVYTAAPSYVPASGSSGTTFRFRVTATDRANNLPAEAFAETTIDWDVPSCKITAFSPPHTPYPGFSSLPLEVEWTVTDLVGEVETLEIWVQDVSDGPTGNWKTLAQAGYCDAMVPAAAGTVDCTPPTGIYQFKCQATDKASNVGPESPVEQVTADPLSPEAGSIVIPAGGWANAVNFFMQWLAPDQPERFASGTEYYNVQWQRTGAGAWIDILNSTMGVYLASASLQFGEGGNDPAGTPIAEGDTFDFRIRGRDFLGQEGPWGENPFTIGIDSLPPSSAVQGWDITDPFTPIAIPPTGGSLTGIAEISVESQARETIPATGTASGLAEHAIIFQWTKEHIFEERRDCPIPPLPPTGNDCTEDFAIPAGADEVAYWAEAEDVAGNLYKSTPVVLAYHPWANFVTHDIFLLLGSSSLHEVQVRNLQTERADVTLTLDGYGLAGWVPGQEKGDFKGVVYDPDLEPNTRDVRVEGLPAGGRGTIRFNVVSSGPGAPVDLDLNADVTTASGGVINGADSDKATIRVGFPPSFSALDAWALLLLVALAGLVFWRGASSGQ